MFSHYFSSWSEIKQTIHGTWFGTWEQTTIFAMWQNRRILYCSNKKIINLSSIKGNTGKKSLGVIPKNFSFHIVRKKEIYWGILILGTEDNRKNRTITQRKLVFTQYLSPFPTRQSGSVQDSPEHPCSYFRVNPQQPKPVVIVLQFIHNPLPKRFFYNFHFCWTIYRTSFFQLLVFVL